MASDHGSCRPAGWAKVLGWALAMGPALLAVPDAGAADGPAVARDAADEGVTVQIQQAYRAARLLPHTCPAPMVALPPALRGHGTSATVRVHVSRDGLAAHAQLVHSSGYPVLDDASLVVLARCRYRPAAQAGRTQPGLADVVYAWPGQGPGPIERAAMIASSAR